MWRLFDRAWFALVMRAGQWGPAAAFSPSDNNSMSRDLGSCLVAVFIATAPNDASKGIAWATLDMGEDVDPQF